MPDAPDIARWPPALQHTSEPVVQSTSQHTAPKWTGWGALVGVLGLGFGVAAIAATAAWQAGWLPASGGSRATRPPLPGAGAAPATPSPKAAAGRQALVPRPRPARGRRSAKSQATLRTMIAGSHRWSVTTARNGRTAAPPISCTIDAGEFTCSDYCGTNAGKMLISADDSKLTQVFVMFCKRPAHKVLEYEVKSFDRARFRLQGPTDWQEWVLDD